MNKNILAVAATFFALLASSLVSSASIAIYTYKGSTNTIGGNHSLSVSDYGTLLIDLPTMAAQYIGQFSTGSRSNLKNYWVSAPLENTINTQVLGPKGASYTVIAAVENPGTRYLGSLAHFQSAVGLNTLVTLRKSGGTETAFLPKTLTSSGFVLTDDSNFDYLSQSFGTYSFNSRSTLACNNANKTLSTVISELETSYRNKNFTRWSSSKLVGMPTPNPPPNNQPQVTTLAGSGSQDDADGQGTTAGFYAPYGVAVDGSGNVYVADGPNHRIRKITPNGYVTTLAGSGTAAYVDGQGTAASFKYPWGLAVDVSGNIYVGDCVNNRIRKITPSGYVTTLAGSGSQSYADGQGTEASFSCPQGVSVDSNGNVYVADGGNARIRKITPSGYVTTLAGSGTAAYVDGQGTAASFGNNPLGVAVDGSGNVYVADTGNNRIRKITISR